MSKFLKGNWAYWKSPDGSFTVVSEEQLIVRTFSAKDFPSVKMTPEEQAQEEAENEAFARAISYLPQIYERLSDVMNTIRAILPKIPKSVDTYDLQVEADLIDDILTRICGEEAQS